MALHAAVFLLVIFLQLLIKSPGKHRSSKHKITKLIWSVCLSFFSCCCYKISEQRPLKKMMVQGYGQSWEGNQGGRGLKQLFTFQLQSRSMRKRMHSSTHFIFSILCSSWWVRMAFPTSTNLSRIIPQRHAQRLIHWASLGSVKLTTDTNNHSMLWPYKNTSVCTSIPLL